MKRLLVPLLGVLLIGNSACAPRKVDHADVAALFDCGAEILSVHPKDSRAPGLVNKLEAQVDAASSEAKNQAEMDLLALYSKAAKCFRLALSKLKTETAEASAKTPADGSLSSADLWNEAEGQLRAAQQRFISGRRLRKEEPVYMDPPMRKWRKH